MSKIINMMMKNAYKGSFGIDYLDKKIRGILPSDLILIGARSGAGKSSIAQSIAHHNAQQGKFVALFSLENFEEDDYLSKAYYFYIQKTRQWDLTMRDFMSCGNGFTPDLEVLKYAEEQTEKYFENICVFGRKRGYDLGNLRAGLVSCASGKVDLIILDHLDYIDKEDEHTHDISHVTEIMRTLRDIQDVARIGIICISHLRKPMLAKEMPKVPSMDEFIGSSNKVKEATAVIMLAPDDETNEMFAGNSKRATYCCVRKLRNGGFDNTCARLNFNIRTGTYDKEYQECSVNYSGTKVEDLTI